MPTTTKNGTELNEKTAGRCALAAGVPGRGPAGGSRPAQRRVDRRAARWRRTEEEIVGPDGLSADLTRGLVQAE